MLNLLSCYNKHILGGEKRLAQCFTSRYLATKSTLPKKGEGVPPDEMPFFHLSPKKRVVNPKFESPRKRANKMFATITEEAIDKSINQNQDVLGVPFRVGDAIEISLVSEGGVNSTQLEKIRGVVLGRKNRGLGSGVYIRDVVLGEPIERKISLHSPLLKSLKVLEKNFVYKGKRKVKRAKLYFLRDRLPQETKVSSGK